MLKEAKYKCWGYGRDPIFPEYNNVVYVIIENYCYFSGVELTLRTSTINAAGSIVKAIANQEHLLARDFRWFDLQTHLGYEKELGEYELDELEIVPNPHGPRKGGTRLMRIASEIATVHTVDEEDIRVNRWIPTDCPREVFQLFREYIMGTTS